MKQSPLTEPNLKSQQRLNGKRVDWEPWSWTRRRVNTSQIQAFWTGNKSEIVAARTWFLRPNCIYCSCEGFERNRLVHPDPPRIKACKPQKKRRAAVSTGVSCFLNARNWVVALKVTEFLFFGWGLALCSNLRVLVLFSAGLDQNTADFVFWDGIRRAQTIPETPRLVYLLISIAATIESFGETPLCPEEIRLSCQIWFSVWILISEL